jgi:two-component system response regulator AdeR
MGKTDILIGEDDTVLRTLYEKKFTIEGFSVRSAVDGEEILRMIGEKKPDLLLLDIHMPKVDGFQVLRELPKKDRGFPVIMLTNFGQEEFKLRALELGADDYFVKKDMTMRSLLEMVKRLIKA